MKRVIDFNHISDRLSREEVEEFKKLYRHYHKLYTCYKWKYKKLKSVRLGLNMGSLTLVVTGGIIGGVTANPIILGCISGSGVLIQGYLSRSNITSKVERCKFAHTSYDKVLTQIRSFLRGLPYNEEVFLSDVKVVDDIVTDMCPPIDSMITKYDKQYSDDLEYQRRRPSTVSFAIDNKASFKRMKQRFNKVSLKRNKENPTNTATAHRDHFIEEVTEPRAPASP